jgi:hypothetical protein
LTGGSHYLNGIGTVPGGKLLEKEKRTHAVASVLLNPVSVDLLRKTELLVELIDLTCSHS